MDNQHHINLLRQELESKLSWGPVGQWHSSMFDELSKKIFEECQVMLSTATLKRFWGVVKHDGKPSITTLDALATFAGHGNWREFKQASQPHKKTKTSSKKTVYVSFGFILAVMIIALVGNKKPDLVINSNEFSFSSRPVGSEYPNSVVFDFEIPSSIRTDSFHIQQYWDNTKTIILDRDQKQATGIYYFPGYFRAKLMVDGQIAKEHDLFLKSNGWMGTIEYEPVPKYFEVEKLGESGLTAPSELIEDMRNSTEPLTSIFHYIKDLGNVSGDNFNLSASVRNTYDEKWAVCQYTRIYIIGTTGAMIIPFSKIGCSSENFLMLNDYALDGKEHDLSAFGTDLTDFTNLEVDVKDQMVSVSINDSTVYQARYEHSMGKIVGARFRFVGLGEVRDYQLTDQAGQAVLLN